MPSNLKNYIRKVVNKPSDDFIPLNGMFSYGLNDKTAHIHMPIRIDEELKDKGLKYTIEDVNENLYDALQKMVTITKNNPKIKQVFAVSPLLSQRVFRERLELLGFKTESADEKFEKYFPGQKGLYQARIPLERLKQVLEIEKETREKMDQNGEFWHNKILYYKYMELKKIGIIDYYNIPLDKIVQMGKMNYNYRHGLSLETKEKRNKQFDIRNESTLPKREKNNLERER